MGQTFRQAFNDLLSSALSLDCFLRQAEVVRNKGHHKPLRNLGRIPFKGNHRATAPEQRVEGDHDTYSGKTGHPA